MGRRSGSGLRWWFLALVAFVLLVRALAPDRKRRAASPAPAESPAYYVSEVEEGIGAAVAILVDTSGSMAQPAPRSGGHSKSEVARWALAELVSVTDAFVERRPDVPIKLAIYGFASSPWVVHPMQAYDGAAVRRALSQLPGPGGGTAIGGALLEARPALYRSGAVRKHIVVITDGQNTAGSPPDRVAREIFRKSRGGVTLHFIAFDTDPAHFDFLSEVGGEVLPAQDAPSLQGALKQIYEGKILAEAMEYGGGDAAATSRPGHVR